MILKLTGMKLKEGRNWVAGNPVIVNFGSPNFLCVERWQPPGDNPEITEISFRSGGGEFGTSTYRCKETPEEIYKMMITHVIEKPVQLCCGTF